MVLEQNRDGQICPNCKKGKLHQISFREHVKDIGDAGIVEGESDRHYRCDYCKEEINDAGIGRGFGVGASTKPKK